MIVYLINKETKEVVQTIENAVEYDENFVITETNGHKGKFYCDENEKFTEVANE